MERDVTLAGEIALECAALDVVLATDEAKRRVLWDVRRGIAEAVHELGVSAELDLAVPRTELVPLVAAIRRISGAAGLKSLAFGHAADGNLHVHLWREGKDPVATASLREDGDRDLCRDRPPRRHGDGGARRRHHVEGRPFPVPPARVPRRDARDQAGPRSERHPEPGEGDPRAGMSAAAGRAAHDPPGRYRVLALLSLAELFGMSLWFSASAVAPLLKAEWRLSDASATWLTLSVQLGFVAGTLASAVLNLPDVWAPRQLVIGATPSRSRRERVARALLARPRLGARPALPDGPLPRGRLSAGDEDPRLVVSRAARPRAGRPHRRAHARQGGPVPRERDLRLRVAPEPARGVRPRARRRGPRRPLRPRRAVRARARALRRDAGDEGLREPRRAARELRLLRPHVGALRDVDVDSRDAPLELRAPRATAGGRRGGLVLRDRMRRGGVRRRGARGRPRGAGRS